MAIDLSRRNEDILSPRAFVKLIKGQWEERPHRSLDANEEDSKSDEGYSPVDGCTLEDVSSMKVAARVLVLREMMFSKKGSGS